MTAAVFTVHTAGSPVGLLQCCVRCGHVLQNGQPWADGNVLVAESVAGPHDRHGPAWWPAGARIGTDKFPGSARVSCTYTLADGRPLDADEVLCTPTYLN